jgi:hypothetical protein
VIQQIVTFKGQVFAKACHKLYVVHLAPELSIEALKVVCGINIGPSKICGVLVACDDKIVMLDMDWEAFFLDLSDEPAKYLIMKDECLEKRAFFFHKEGSIQARHTMNPGRLGLRGGHVYQFDQKGQVYLYPATDRRSWRIPLEHRIVTLNTYILHNLASFTAWV